MFVPYKLKTGVRAVTLALTLAAASLSAHAVLQRVAPANNAPSIGGFPSWYQDNSGLALEFCDPKNASEVEGGWCLLLPGDIPNVPEVFPANFFDEHFYWAAGTGLAHGSQLRGVATLAMESAFATGTAAPGAQITFARIRLVYTPVPVTGTYRFIHPFGEDLIFAEAGGRIFYTDDVGVGCAPGSFDCALNSRLGPFLLPSATPGGPEDPPLTATNPAPDTNPAHFGGTFAATPYPGTGNAYIADPARSGPVTGSPLPNFIDSSGASRNHNIIRLEGPVGSNLGGPGIDFVESTDFSLMGRVYTGTIPSKVDVERASYTRSATGQQVDVIANAFPTAVGRLPAQPVPAPLPPQLTFFDAPCAGTLDAAGNLVPPFGQPTGATETQMFANGSHYWGQIRPAILPTAVCVKDGSARDVNGNVVPNFALRQLSDEVSVSQAAYDPATGALTVAASSSDTLVPPTLSLAYGTFRGDLTGGQITLPVVVVPPASVQVQSSAKGFRNQKVSVGATGVAPPPAVRPVAVNDSASFLEDAGPQQLAVLANDTDAIGGTVTITAAPVLGTTIVNADGTVTYTPRLHANGTDVFSYMVTAGTQISNTGTVSLSIAPVNDPPVAVNESAVAVVNVPISIAVLANDTDPDGATEILAAVNLTQPAAGATATLAGGVVSFNATTAGIYSFTYQAQDQTLTTSNPATVTVQVVNAETLSIGRAEYGASDGRLRVEGSIAPASGQTITLDFVNATGTALGAIGSTIAAAGGNWSYQASGVVRPTGASAVRATSSNGTVRTLNLAIK